MCGITTLLEPTAPDWTESTARSMTRAIKHRGPDGEGLLFASLPEFSVQTAASDETPDTCLDLSLPYCPARTSPPRPRGTFLALGHRRLSIIDLSAAGHQPMCDPQAQAWITFNGEIYNHLELRKELEQLGHRFNSHTDTEVILAAYLEWGKACLSRLKGMFAFVILDHRRRQLFLARDRFGIKPLYYWLTPTGGLAVASEIKQFTQHPAWNPVLNGQMAYDFLNWGLIHHGRETLFRDVLQIPGGHAALLPITPGKAVAPADFHLWQWYDLRPAPFAGSFEEAGRQFHHLFTESVRMHLRADVPVGSCLSGGLDSSSIVCTMQGLLGSQAGALQNTFSACSESARFDESNYIAEVVSKTGARAHYVVPNPEELLAKADQLTWHQDAPFGSTSIFAQWCVFDLARKAGIRVMLDGQGADEALGGYHGYFHYRLAGLLMAGRLPSFFREAAELSQVHGISRGEHIRGIANLVLPSAPANLLRSLVGRTVLRPSFVDLKLIGARPHLPPNGKHHWRNAVNHLCKIQLTTTLPMLLHWEDRNSMAHGVEARVPFLDHDLVEFCLGLPEEYKLRGAWTKRVLREGMRDLLPEKIRLRRDKLGFATAEEVWMKETHRPQFEKLLESSVDQGGGVLTPALLEHGRRMLSGQIRFNFSLWRCISFANWMARFSVRPSS